MRTIEPDLVLLKDGRPVVLVEAKGRALAPESLRTALSQLSSYASATHSEWAILIDPEVTRVFLAARIPETAVVIPTRRILAEADLGSVSTIGEAVLVLATQRWLETLSERSDSEPADLPQAFLLAIQGADEYASMFTRA